MFREWMFEVSALSATEAGTYQGDIFCFARLRQCNLVTNSVAVDQAGNGLGATLPAMVRFAALVHRSESERICPIVRGFHSRAEIGLAALIIRFSTLMPIATSATWAETQTIIDSAKLEAFVKAAIAVNDVIDRWQPLIDAASSEARVDQLREQADGEIEAVIAGTENMSLDEYRTIYHAAQTDAVLAAMITELFKKRMGQ